MRRLRWALGACAVAACGEVVQTASVSDGSVTDVTMDAGSDVGRDEPAAPPPDVHIAEGGGRDGDADGGGDAGTDAQPDLVPPTFGGLTQVLLNSAEVHLSWESATDDRARVEEIRYAIYASRRAGIQDPPLLVTRPGATSAVVPVTRGWTPSPPAGEVASNATYHWAVRALDGAQNLDDNTREIAARTFVNYDKDVQPMFSVACAKTTCHNSENPPQGLTLEEGFAPQSSIGVPSNWMPELKRIDDTNPDPAKSFIWLKMRATWPPAGAGVHMPPPLGNVEPDYYGRSLVRLWIQQGAKLGAPSDPFLPTAPLGTERPDFGDGTLPTPALYLPMDDDPYPPRVAVPGKVGRASTGMTLAVTRPALTAGLTVAVWFSPQLGDLGERRVRLDLSTTGTAFAWLSVDVQGAFSFNVATDLGESGVQASAVPTDAWHHAAAVLDGQTMRLYVDGELAAERAYRGALELLSGLDAHGLEPRALPVDELAAFDVPLSATEIQVLYQTGLAGRPLTDVVRPWGR